MTHSPSDPQTDLLDLIRAGRKIEAVKLAREVLGLGLAEAKELVDGLERDDRAGPAGWPGGGPAPGGHAAPAPATAAGPAAWDPEIDRLLRARRKIEAVKAYRDRAGCGLKEAKDAIEQRAVALGLQSRPSKCFIATAAWGGGEQAEVMALRRFRNRVLQRSRAGRVVIRVYEALSPPLAALVARSGALAWCVRALVGGLTACARRTPSRPRRNGR